MEKCFNYGRCLGLIFVGFRFGWFGMTHLKYFKTFKNRIPANHVIQLRLRKLWHLMGREVGVDEVVSANFFSTFDVLLWLEICFISNRIPPFPHQKAGIHENWQCQDTQAPPSLSAVAPSGPTHLSRALCSSLGRGTQSGRLFGPQHHADFPAKETWSIPSILFHFGSSRAVSGNYSSAFVGKG